MNFTNEINIWWSWFTFYLEWPVIYEYVKIQMNSKTAKIDTLGD
jgi:hypothetical protein